MAREWDVRYQRRVKTLVRSVCECDEGSRTGELCAGLAIQSGEPPFDGGRELGRLEWRRLGESLRCRSGRWTEGIEAHEEVCAGTAGRETDVREGTREQ